MAFSRASCLTAALSARFPGYQQDHCPWEEMVSLIQRLFSFGMTTRRRWEMRHMHRAALRKLLVHTLNPLCALPLVLKNLPVAKLQVERRQSSERSQGSESRRNIQTDRKLQMPRRRKRLTCSRKIPLARMQSWMVCPWSQGDLAEEHETKL